MAVCIKILKLRLGRELYKLNPNLNVKRPGLGKPVAWGRGDELFRLLSNLVLESSAEITSCKEPF